MRKSRKTPDEILGEVFQIALKKGLIQLTLRSIAKEIDTSARMLIYHFGSFEKLMEQVHKRYSVYQKQSTRRQLEEKAPIGDIMRNQFEILRDRSNQNLFTLFAELSAQALRHPKEAKDFVQSSFADWLEVIYEALKTQGFTRRQSDALGTIILSVQRGLITDLMCHDGAPDSKQRVEDALELFSTLLSDRINLFKGKDAE